MLRLLLVALAAVTLAGCEIYRPASPEERAAADLDTLATPA